MGGAKQEEVICHLSFVIWKYPRVAALRQMTNDQRPKKKKASTVAGKLSSIFRGLLFGAEAAEVNVSKRENPSGIRLEPRARDAERVTRNAPRYFRLVVFFFFLAAFFFIALLPPFFGNQFTLPKILSQRFFST